MKLILEIGNSSTKLAVCNGFKISNINYLENIDNSRFLVNLNSIIKNLVLKKPNINQIVISYVNRKIMTKIKKNLINKFPNLKLNILKEKKYKNFKIKYKNIDSVGLDRFFNCLGARTLNNKTGSIVVDIGTATTFDVINQLGSYVGGVIAPGVSLSTKALYEAAAALPYVEVKRPNKVVGRNTISCMQSGIYWGYLSLVDGIISKIKNEKKISNVIATGGLSSVFSRDTTIFDKIDLRLTIKGLVYISSFNEDK